ncbi:NlpC/P60 family protein [Rhabdothermincola salaria]|uniref:C40 family peptidase n=1 Tax=Rhabdothermincola salaria TaxID=2903142 RepID=UPI001E657B3B|nr:C40 family peptidase [Rhabdothermincola salaria]MCD9624793.1 NlpC/P60 family protein [Rhabdothermincola salaria]
MRTERSPRATRRNRKVLSGIVVAGILAVPVAGGLPASAQSSISDKRAEAAEVAAELTELDNRLMTLNAEAEAASYELHQAEEQVGEARARVEHTNAELEQRRSELRTFAVKAYQTGGEDPVLNAVLTTEADTAPAKQSYITVTTGNRSDLVDSLSAMRRQAEDETKALEQAQAEAEAITRRIAEKRDEVASATEAQRAINERVQGELAGLVAEEQERQRQAAARAAEEAARQAQAEAAAQQQQQQARSSQSTSQRSSSTQAPRPEAPTAPPAPTAPTAPTAPSTPAPAPADPGPVRSGIQGAIDLAVSKAGNSTYVWGASGPNSFDCSGLLVWAFSQVGISLPHYSGAQYNATTRISRSQVQAGDLVFWGSGGSEHVALAIGPNTLVHAFGSLKGVGITNLDGWWKAPSGYGRIR